jgi:hypothetical protein
MLNPSRWPGIHSEPIMDPFSRQSSAACSGPGYGAPNPRLRRAWAAIGWALVFLTIVLSLRPLPAAFAVGNLDKLMHILTYATLTLWFIQLAPAERWIRIALVRGHGHRDRDRARSDGLPLLQLRGHGGERGGYRNSVAGGALRLVEPTDLVRAGVGAASTGARAPAGRFGNSARCPRRGLDARDPVPSPYLGRRDHIHRPVSTRPRNSTAAASTRYTPQAPRIRPLWISRSTRSRGSPLPR